MGVLVLTGVEKHLRRKVDRKALIDREGMHLFPFLRPDLQQVVFFIEVDVLSELVDVATDRRSVDSESAGDFGPTESLGMRMEQQFYLCNTFTLHDTPFCIKMQQNIG